MPITINRIDKDLADWLQREAAKRGITKEAFALAVLRQHAAHARQKQSTEKDLKALKENRRSENNSTPTGATKSTKTPSQEELLVQLAGTWSQKEITEFEKHTSSFNQIDDDLWQ